MGLQLFQRSSRAVSLTAAGETLAREWRPALERIERGERRALAAGQGEHGVLTVAYTDFAIAGVLSELIQGFTATYPGVRITTRHAVTWLQNEGLQDGSIDLGFVTGPVDRQVFECLPVQSDRCVAVAHKEHWLAARNSVCLAELSEEAFILGNEKDWQHFHAYIYGECSRVGFRPRVVQRAFNSVALFGLIAAGMGIILTAETARNYLHPDLVIRPISDFSMVIPTFAA